MDFELNITKRGALRQEFTPGRPVDKYRLFAGRRDQVDDVYDAVITEGMHVLLYGERGVGKTSLAQVLHQFLERAKVYSLNVKTINCDRTDDFTSLWLKVFREMNAEGHTAKDMLGAVLDKDLITPDDVRFFLTRLDGYSLIIFDEFDKLPDPHSRVLFADTIKNLADHAVKTTIMLVGVADTVDELISEHKSIERSLSQVRMPRMAADEITEIIERGFKNVEMEVSVPAKRLIVLLSQGLPFYAHYLGLYSGLAALDQNRTLVEMVDVSDSTVKIVKKAHHVQTSYLAAVSSAQKNSIYPKVLLACAMVQTDEAGFFSASDVSIPMSEIAGKRYEVQDYLKHLKNFCNHDREKILVAVGPPNRVRYRFADALMQPYVILDGIAKGMLSVNTILKRKESKDELESH